MKTQFSLYTRAYNGQAKRQDGRFQIPHHQFGVKFFGYGRTWDEAVENLNQKILNAMRDTKGTYTIAKKPVRVILYNPKIRLKRIWHLMIKRCNNPAFGGYRYYGAKGISVCSEWMHSFDSFANWAIKNGYKEDLTIDRIDPIGNYEPLNCQWATLLQQARNKRNSQSRTRNNCRNPKKLHDLQRYKLTENPSGDYLRGAKNGEYVRFEDVQKLVEELTKTKLPSIGTIDVD